MKLLSGPPLELLGQRRLFRRDATVGKDYLPNGPDEATLRLLVERQHSQEMIIDRLAPRSHRSDDARQDIAELVVQARPHVALVLCMQ